MISAPMSPLIVDAGGHYHMSVPPSTEATLYSSSHFLRPASESYPIVGTVPVVPYAHFNPSVPPPAFQGVIDPPDEVIDFGFSFPAPPANMDVSSVNKSERADGSDLPRMEVLR